VTLTVVIADDEPLARKQLRDLVGEVSWLRCLAETADGLETVEAVNGGKPDLLFLDIQMPNLSGIEVLGQMEHRPGVVFTTAYDRYAVTAFELHALDYLLKPFGRARFMAAVERARQSLEQDSSTLQRARMALASSGPVTRLFVRERGKILPVAVHTVERMEARDDYVALFTATRRYLIHIAMNDLEGMLNPDTFVRVHRCHIVNLDFVASLTPCDSSRLQIEMRNGVRLVASRARSKLLRSLAR
jgi:two-component system, LytTR family, response regulator